MSYSVCYLQHLFEQMKMSLTLLVFIDESGGKHNTCPVKQRSGWGIAVLPPQNGAVDISLLDRSAGSCVPLVRTRQCVLTQHAAI